MVLGADLLLEQRGGVGDRLVGNLQRIGDFGDLVAAAQQPKNFQLARCHLGRRICVNASSIFTVLSDANSDRQPARTTAWSSTIRTFVADLSDFCIIQPLAGKILR